jgi:hypothetical protein
MASENDPRPVLRQELARVFKNQRVIRAFEKIFDLIPPEFIDQQQQIDELTTALADVLAELSIVPQLGELQARVAELAKEIQDLKQGVVI